MRMAITILLSLVPFFWHKDGLLNQLFGYGEYLSPVNAFQEITNRLAMFYPKVEAGSNIAFLTPHIFPFLGWHAVLSYFHISSLIASLSFLSLILFCSQISMRAWLNYVLRYKFKVKVTSIWFFSFIAGVLYGFSPFYIWLIAPSHIYQLIAMALFPWMLLLIDKLLTNSMSQKTILTRLFLLFLCSAPAFANIGIFYVLFVVFSLYIAAYWITREVSLFRAFYVLIMVILTAVTANIWWLLPYVYTINETININFKSDIITTNISTSVGAAYILNILLGHPELLLYLSPQYQIYLSKFFETGTLIMVGCSLLLIRYWKKYIFSLICLIMLISAIYIVKGDQPPLAWVFVQLYSHFPGFQIFRRPVSKYYFVYWFFLLTLSISFLSIFYNRIRNNNKFLSSTVNIFLSVFTVGILFAFIMTKEGNTFSIPQYYYDASSYLQKMNVTRVLLLPDLQGSPPTFDNQWIRYSGADFFPAITKSEFIVPDKTNYSADFPSKKLANKMVDEIRNGQSFCETASFLGVSHIVLRHDLSTGVMIVDDPEATQQKLEKSPDIGKVKLFGINSSIKRLSIYEIRSECRRNLIQISSGTATSRTIIPGLIVLHVKGAAQNTIVKSLYNYSDQWVAYEDVKSSRIPPYLRAAGFLLQDAINTIVKRPQYSLPHTLADGYANRWTIIGQKDSQTNVILVYRPQYVFYLGVFLFMLVIFEWYFLTRKDLWKK